jgi:hypothetical protein
LDQVVLDQQVRKHLGQKVTIQFLVPLLQQVVVLGLVSIHCRKVALGVLAGEAAVNIPLVA